MTVTLRRWRPDDAALASEARADAYIALIENAARDAWLETRVADEWARVIEVDGVTVGGVGASRRHVPGLAEIGYWVLEGSRGNGVATEAAAQFTDWLFVSTDIERLQATVEPWNKASQRVLEKAGFKREGLMRGYASWHGKRRDVLLYAKLAGD